MHPYNGTHTANDHSSHTHDHRAARLSKDKFATPTAATPTATAATTTTTTTTEQRHHHRPRPRKKAATKPRTHLRSAALVHELERHVLSLAIRGPHRCRQPPFELILHEHELPRLKRHPAVSSSPLLSLLLRFLAAPSVQGPPSPVGVPS